MEEPLESAELLAFTRTVDARSLSRAALELRVPRATIGRRLQRLEERLGVRLLRRTTRSLLLTDAGEALYRSARIALDAVRQAEESVRRRDDVVRGELRVSVPPFTNPHFHTLIADFMLRYPEVSLQLHFSTQHADLQRGAFDVAIRGTRALEPGLVARVLTRSSLIAVAAPSYLARKGKPRTLRDLRQHSCLLSFARGELPQTHWIDRKGRQVQVAGGIASNDITFLRQAAIDGIGIAYLPLEHVRPALDDGRLVQVLKGNLETTTQLAVVYLEREFLAPQVRAFVDAVVVFAREHPEALWPEPPRPLKA
ncbi:MAG TPA: LysR family transcriptional regulator [Polyangiales bacterium]|nr:LysR family transcriptional regulator [Polyangiales bacterium]